MDNKKAADDLRALALQKKTSNPLTGKRARNSQTALLAGLLDDVEAALQAGASRGEVLAVLQKQGFTLSLQGLMTALQRLRKRRAALPLSPDSGHPTKEQTHSTNSAPQATPATSPSPKTIPPTSAPQPNELEEKKERYRLFRESIKHLPLRERTKREQEFFDSLPTPSIIK